MPIPPKATAAGALADHVFGKEASHDDPKKVNSIQLRGRLTLEWGPGPVESWQGWAKERQKASVPFEEAMGLGGRVHIKKHGSVGCAVATFVTEGARRLLCSGRNASGSRSRSMG